MQLRNSLVNDGGFGTAIEGITPVQVDAWANIHGVEPGESRETLWLCVHTLDMTLRGKLRKGKAES